jgi:hypothetical protein
VEAAIAANTRTGSQLAYAADAALEAILPELAAAFNWTDILTGTVSSSLHGFAMPPVGPGESPIGLTQLTAIVQAENDARGSWGPNSPRWRLFAHGWLTEVVPVASADSDEYVAAFVADDVSETDGNPMVDTNRRLQLSVRSSNARGMHRTVLATLEQTTERTAAGLPGVRVLAWKEIR